MWALFWKVEKALGKCSWRENCEEKSGPTSSPQNTEGATPEAGECVWDHKTRRRPAEGLVCVCVCACVCVCVCVCTYHAEMLDPLGYSPFPQGEEERARKGRIWGPRV